MAIGSILLGLSLLIVVGLFLARPLLIAKPEPTKQLTRRQQLEQDKEAYLREIRALDFDYETGNIPPEVYEQQRAQLVKGAAAILKELDDLPADEGEVYSQIEAAVAAKRHQHAMSSNGQARFCTQCGHRLDEGDKFCSRCGEALHVVQPTT
jgi:hypothetical protein